jgi:hypothetical protein
MEVVSTTAGLLCNFEVLEIIKSRKNQRLQNFNANFQDRDFVESRVEKYIEKSLPKNKKQSDCARLIHALKERNLLLTEAEYIGIFNYLPTSLVEIHLVEF